MLFRHQLPIAGIVVLLCSYNFIGLIQVSKQLGNHVLNPNYEALTPTFTNKTSGDDDSEHNDEATLTTIVENRSSISLKESHEDCILIKNKVLPSNITHSNDRLIPRVIHLFIPKRCLPPSIVESIIQPWLDVPQHSILFHDFEEISHKLSTHRYDFVRRACYIEQDALVDLARFVYLYDEGGLSFDIDYIPGPGFRNGTIFDAGSSARKGYDNKPIHVVVESDSDGRFVAAEPNNFLIMSSLLLTVGKLYSQFSSLTYHKFRAEVYPSYINNLYFAGKPKSARQVIIIRRPAKNMRLFTTHLHIMLNSSRLPGGEMLRLVSPLPQQLRFSLNQSCAQFLYEKQARNPPSMEALMNLTDHDQIMSCPPGLVPISNQILPNRSYSDSNKLIPPMLHMTAKSKCLTPAYRDNINAWKDTQHSFFLHDDAAVQRLFDEEEWLEFPLLREVLPCVNSGAMKADIWRYLFTWKYGGIYTDMDNSPGLKSLWEGDHSIKPEDDAFFEVERDGFPSQYFFAVSPHHPISYFMLSRAIYGLLCCLKSVQRTALAVSLTGPGACKTGIMNAIGGSGYYNAAVYSGVGNRSVTIVGNKRTARRGVYAWRSNVTGDLELMNMSHYQNVKNPARIKLPNHPCLREVFEKLQKRE